MRSSRTRERSLPTREDIHMQGPGNGKGEGEGEGGVVRGTSQYVTWNYLGDKSLYDISLVNLSGQSLWSISLQISLATHLESSSTISLLISRGRSLRSIFQYRHQFSPVCLSGLLWSTSLPKFPANRCGKSISCGKSLMVNDHSLVESPSC